MPTLTPSRWRCPALLLAVHVRVAGVDHAGVGVRSAVDGVVPGDVVPRLQEVVPALVAVRRVVAPADIAVDPGGGAADLVGALAAEEPVALVVPTDLVEVLLPADDVVPLVAGEVVVVSLAAADHVVALEAARLVTAGLRADHVVAGCAGQDVVGSGADDRAVLRRAGDAPERSVRERGPDRQGYGRGGDDDASEPHPVPPILGPNGTRVGRSRGAEHAPRCAESQACRPSRRSGSDLLAFR